MPKTATHYRNQILTHFKQAGTPITKSRAMKHAIRIHRHHQNNPGQDFYESLRILGIIADPTARDAIRNLTTPRAAA